MIDVALLNDKIKMELFDTKTSRALIKSLIIKTILKQVHKGYPWSRQTSYRENLWEL